MRRPKTVATPMSRLISGTRAEKIRLRADTRDGRPVVRLDLLEPLASHSSAMTVVGRAVLIPSERVDELIQALYAAKVDGGEARADAPKEDEF